MDSPMVSVIIPVYKAEPFLDECLNSVIGQDYPALEIILVDDGSPDACPEMCDRYTEAYDRIKTIHKDNGGPGPARNAGLKAAAGKYIAFVDSDDCLDGAGAIRRMVEQAEKKQADIVVGAYRRSTGRQLGGISCFRFQDGAYTETVDFRFKGFNLYNHLTTPWCKLYRRAFLVDHNIKYRDYPFLEDKSFNMMCCAYRPVYTSVDESVYVYRANSGSITSQYRDYHIAVCTAVASDFERFLSERGITEEYSDLIAFHLGLGLYFVPKQELMRAGIWKAGKALSGYAKNPLVRKMVKRLVCGMYIDQIKPKTWKAMIWGASLLCSLHAYVPLTLGVWALQKMKVDERLINAKYAS